MSKECYTCHGSKQIRSRCPSCDGGAKHMGCGNCGSSGKVRTYHDPDQSNPYVTCSACNGSGNYKYYCSCSNGYIWTRCPNCHEPETYNDSNSHVRSSSNSSGSNNDGCGCLLIILIVFIVIFVRQLYF